MNMEYEFFEATDAKNTYRHVPTGIEIRLSDCWISVTLQNKENLTWELKYNLYRKLRNMKRDLEYDLYGTVDGEKWPREVDKV